MGRKFKLHYSQEGIEKARLNLQRQVKSAEKDFTSAKIFEDEEILEWQGKRLATAKQALIEFEKEFG